MQISQLMSGSDKLNLSQNWIY